MYSEKLWIIFSIQEMSVKLKTPSGVGTVGNAKMWRYHENLS